MRARICGTWEMDLPEVSEEPWFLDWVVRSPKHAGDHLACSIRTFEAFLPVYGLDAFPRVHEYFGGIGAHALMVESLYRPMLMHTVADYALPAVEHMKRVLPEGVEAMQMDAYNSNPVSADLHVMDFGDLTVWKAQPGRDRGDLLDLVFDQQPRAVTITDIAARYLHLHKHNYEPILGAGTCDSYEDYLEAFSWHLEERYGYVMIQGNYTRWSAVMAFVPKGMAEHGEFRKLPANAQGLVLS